VLHDSPNFDQTAIDFWEFICVSLELWGNAYARIERNNGRVVGLMPIRPDIMAVRRRDSGAIEYNWSEDGKSYRLTDEQVLHVRGFGGDPLGGMSTLSYGRQTFGLSIAADRAASAMFRNGMRPSVQLSFPQYLKSAEQYAGLEARIAKDFAGAMNVGRPFIAEGGSRLEPISINPEDAQMLESRGFGVEDVCRFFGVPPFMVGHTEKSTSWGTGLEQQTLGFQKFTLRRRVKRIEQAVEKQLLTPDDRSNGIRVEFNFESLLRSDTASRVALYTGLANIGALTINEIRAQEGLPPVAGGDQPRMQMQMVPITEAGREPQRSLENANP
jgi:HK97 family phage portal protein